MSTNVLIIIFNQTSACSTLTWDDEYRCEEMISSIVKRTHDVTSTIVAEKIAWFFMELCFESEKGRKLASTNEVYLLLIRKCCCVSNLNSQTVYKISRAICRIVFSNPEGQDIFATMETVGAFSVLS